MKELALNILDIAQNSLDARASEIKLQIKESDKSNILSIEITDNGAGISEDMLKTVDDPYTTGRTSRNIGMGIPLLKYHAQQAGGNLEISSRKNIGTNLKVWFRKDHIDRQPMGDLSGVIRILLSTEKEVNFIYEHHTDIGSFRISSQEIKNELELVNLLDNELLTQIENLIRINIKDLGSDIN